MALVKQNWKPILTLVLITPFLAEHLSTNISGLQFLRPDIFFFLVIIGYSLPVLVIRELAIRWKLGVYGIFLLGFAYGFYNEGLLAKTLLLGAGIPGQASVPVPAFDNYSYYFRINFGWLLSINTWHALHSVLYPILIVYYLYPSLASKPWLGKKTTVALAIPGLVMGTIGFFQVADNGAKGTPGLFIFFFLAILLLAILARRFSGPSLQFVNLYSGKMILLGAGFLVAYILASFALAGIKIPFVILLAYDIVILVLFAAILRKNNWFTLPALLLFGLGTYISTGIFGYFNLFSKGDLVGLVIQSLLILSLIVFIFKIKKQSSLKPT